MRIRHFKSKSNQSCTESQPKVSYTSDFGSLNWNCYRNTDKFIPGTWGSWKKLLFFCSCLNFLFTDTWVCQTEEMWSYVSAPRLLRCSAFLFLFAWCMHTCVCLCKHMSAGQLCPRYVGTWPSCHKPCRGRSLWEKGIKCIHLSQNRTATILCNLSASRLILFQL